MTPTGPAQETEFTANDGTAARAAGVELERGRGAQAAVVDLCRRELSGEAHHECVHVCESKRPAALAGDYLLTNGREDRYSSEEFDVRKLFANGYTLYVSYTHSSARTNAALDYLPTPSPLGPQQSGPLAVGHAESRDLLGMAAGAACMLKKRWDFVYLLDWHNGFPFTAVNAAQQVVGAAGAQRFPDFVNFSPGLEWKFHFRGQYWGLRGVMENATDSGNPAMVNNVVDSPEFGTFSEFQGRAFTARIRLIGSEVKQQ